MERKDISYLSLAFNPPIPGLLDKQIPNQHVTIAFAPTEEQFKQILPYLGMEFEIKPIGYGIDAKNEGLLVEIPENIPYFGADQRHITLSISRDGKAVDTGTMEFADTIPDEIKAKMPDRIVGTISAFTKSRELIIDPSKFVEYEKSQEKALGDALVTRAQLDGTGLAYMKDLLRCEYTLRENDSYLPVTLDELSKLFLNKEYLDGRHVDLIISDPLNESIAISDVKDVAVQDSVVVIQTDDYIYSNAFAVGDYVIAQQQTLESQDKDSKEKEEFDGPSEPDAPGRSW